MFPGETVSSGAPSTCAECGKEMELDVCSTPRGYFLGYMCSAHGVCTRETDYFDERQAAADALETFLGGGIMLLQRH